MGNLLEKLGLKKEKPILIETTLTDKDLVYLSLESDDLILAREGHLYCVKENFSKINPSDPKISLIYIGEVTKLILKVFEFRPYGEVRSSS